MWSLIESASLTLKLVNEQLLFSADVGQFEEAEDYEYSSGGYVFKDFR